MRSSETATAPRQRGLPACRTESVSPEQRLTEIREEEYGLQTELVDEDEVAEALRAFASLWESFSPREQARVIELLIERIDYDGANSTVSVTFRPAGITEIKPVSPGSNRYHRDPIAG